MNYTAGQPVIVSIPGRMQFAGVVEHIHTAPGFVAVRSSNRAGTIENYPASFVASAKVLERTEDGSTTTVSVQEGLDELNAAMMAPQKYGVKEVSSGRKQHSITYKDGRKVMMRLVDVEPDLINEVCASVEKLEAGPKAWTGARIITVDGRTVPIERPGTTSPVGPQNAEFPLTRADFHSLTGRRRVLRMSWDNPCLGGREVYRIGYASHFGWSVLRDWPGWYAAVLTSPRTYDDCAKYLTECIVPGRWWSGENLTVDEWD